MDNFLAELKTALAAYYTAWRVVYVAEGEPSSDKTIVIAPATVDVNAVSAGNKQRESYSAIVEFFADALADVTAVDLKTFQSTYPQLTSYRKLKWQQGQYQAAGIHNKRWYVLSVQLDAQEV